MVKSLIKTALQLSYYDMTNLKSKIDGYDKKNTWNTHRFLKQNYGTVWKKKIAQWVKPASLNALYYAKISCDNKKYKPK